jgi:hypothetical protein
VVEGPSGIGKTTAVIKAITEAGIADKIIPLSARKKEDASFISVLPGQLPIGTVLIDDFHRLEDGVKKVIADLMKTLADESAAHSKLIVLGITNAGQSLFMFGKDLANRVEVIQFEANPEDRIRALVDKGEQSLNVSINIRDDIISAAQGSFYIAQMLCYHTCLRANLLQRQEDRSITTESYESIRSHVMKVIARSFHDTAVSFARGAKLRREGRAPYLHLLYWVSQSKSWTINALREADRHPEQRGSVAQVVNKGFLRDLIEDSEDIQRVLHFDSISGNLVVQDPQFVFYIRNISWPQFAEEVGFLSLDFPSRYDFALSFAGAERDIAGKLFELLQEFELEVFYDKNEQHRIIAEDVEEYLAPIYASDAQIVVCIISNEYPKRIWTKFESDQFKERFRTGEVVPIFLSESYPGMFDSAGRVGYLTIDRQADITPQLQSIADTLRRKIADVREKRRRLIEESAKK